MTNRVITALLEHKFDMSNMESLDEDEDCYSPVMAIVHNNVNLSFRLALRAKDSREVYEDCVGVYIDYVDGPTEVLKMGYAIFVANGPDREPVCLLHKEGTKFPSLAKVEAKRYGWGTANGLPGTLEDLRDEGYLCQEDTLHAFAILFIPEAAFEDPKNKFRPSSAQNSFRRDLYLETETPTATNSPLCNRFEMISNDGHHFWVHKEVLKFNSDEFKQMFDLQKPDDARFKYLKAGRMTLGNASGGALKEMITYLYLQHTTPDFDQFAMELVPVAEMYGLKGLGLICVQTLFVLTENAKVGHILVAQAGPLAEVVKEQNDVDRELLLKVTDHAHKHAYHQLKTVCQQKLVQHIKEYDNLTVAIIHGLGTQASKYGMNELLLACGQWLTNNWEKVANNGQLSDVMRDETGGLFTQMMALALKKK